MTSPFRQDFGRPSKCNESVAQRFAEAVGKGISVKSCCAYAGIVYSTYLTWMKRAEVVLAALEAGDINEIAEPDLPYVHFHSVVSQAHAELEAQHTEHWQEHAVTDWQASKEFLSRRFPQEWGNRTDRPSNGSEPDAAASNAPTVNIYIPSNGRDDAPAPSQDRNEGRTD